MVVVFLKDCFRVEGRLYDRDHLWPAKHKIFIIWSFPFVSLAPEKMKFPLVLAIYHLLNLLRHVLG
jgi:hypothetical protein